MLIWHRFLDMLSPILGREVLLNHSMKTLQSEPQEKTAVNLKNVFEEVFYGLRSAERVAFKRIQICFLNIWDLTEIS